MKSSRMAVLAAVLAVICLALGAQPAAIASQHEEAAVKAADRWLALVDDGQMAESWLEAASLFRNAVSQRDWERSVGTVRSPLGKLISRQVRSTHYMTDMPGAPDGRYVAIQYDAVYEHKKSAVETVTPMDDGGEWRVSGYYIR
ncbi:MAG: DUF4019 domain-containing protein [Myxococcota bacterium]